MIRFLSVSLFAMVLCLRVSVGQQHATDRGSWVVGGQAGFSSAGNSGVDLRSTSLLINPRALYFAIPGLAVGGEALTSFLWAGGATTTRLGGGPAAAYYFGGADGVVRPFVSASAGLTNIQFGEDSGFNLVTYRASGGAVLMLSRAVGLSGELYFRESRADGSATNEVGITVGVAAFIF